MKVALVSPPTPNPSPAYFGPPYGLSLLGALLEGSGHTVVAYDWDRRSTESMLADVPRLLDEDAPDLLGVSVLSVNRAPALELIRAVKARSPRTTIVAGGAFPTADPGWLLERGALDFVCAGDGEETLVELADALAEGRDARAVPGLWFRDGEGRIAHAAPRGRFEALDSLPFPDFELFGASKELARYADDGLSSALREIDVDGRRPYHAGSALMVLTSRGCVYRCTFCPMSKGDHRLRAHGVGYAVDLVEHLRRLYGGRHFVFGDNFFTWPRERALALCQEIIDRGLDIDWICMTRADRVDDELLGLMARAGCREISYGIESFDPRVQRTIRKNLDLGGVAETFRATRRARISSTLMLMVGNQGDCRASLRSGIAPARTLEPDRVLVKTTKVYPGTALWDSSLAAGMFSDAELAAEDAPTRDHVAELGAEELAELERMLRPRTCYLALGEGVSTAAAKRCLSLGAFRGEELVLGGEPVTRADFPELLQHAAAARAKRLWLVTDAHALRSRAVTQALHGFFEGIIAPLFSPKPERHDELASAKGSFERTRAGLLQWSRHGGKVRAWAFLDRLYVSQVADQVRVLAEQGVSEVVLVARADPAGFYRIESRELPGLSEVPAALESAWGVARALGIELEVSGVPECLAPDALLVRDLWRPFDELLSVGATPRALPLARMEDKCKGLKCAECARRSECEGVWSEWLDRDGEAALVPLGPDRGPT